MLAFATELFLRSSEGEDVLFAEFVILLAFRFFLRVTEGDDTGVNIFSSKVILSAILYINVPDNSFALC